MNVAYFDCFAGASGDMLLGALIDAGLSLDHLQREISVLPVAGYTLRGRRDTRGFLSGTKIDVVLDEQPKPPRRTLGVIEGLLQESTLPAGVKAQAITVFRRLARVEAGIHGVAVDEVHFHEVGATDAIVDVVGTLLGLKLLEVDQVYCSPLPAGSGVLRGSHGVFPLPAPATLGLLAEARAPVAPPPVEGVELGELVTPTAAAILSTIATFRQPAMTLQAVGYGLGTRDNPALPNALRVWIGQEAASPVTGEVHLLETNIDDMNPEVYGYVAERLFAAGALDVWHTPIQMKKNRPGVQLSVLARPDDVLGVVSVLLQETSTLGVRTHVLRRWEAEREIVRFTSTLGEASLKVKRLQGKTVQVAPEYEDCRKLALHHKLPLREVYRLLEAEGWTMMQGTF